MAKPCARVEVLYIQKATRFEHDGVRCNPPPTPVRRNLAERHEARVRSNLLKLKIRPEACEHLAKAPLKVGREVADAVLA